MPIDSPLVERVARAICEQALYDRRGFASSGEEIDRQWHNYVAQAHASIEIVNGDHGAAALRKAMHEAWGHLLFSDALELGRLDEDKGITSARTVSRCRHGLA